MTAINPTQNPKVERRIREFLKALNSSGGKPIETLTPAEARKILVDAQASVPLDLPACDLEKTITQDGLGFVRDLVADHRRPALLPELTRGHGRHPRRRPGVYRSWLSAVGPPAANR